MKRSFLLLTLVVSVCLCGCVTIEVVTPEHLSGQQFSENTAPVAHIRAENWGWYLFKQIPLIAGNVEHPPIPVLFHSYREARRTGRGGH